VQYNAGEQVWLEGKNLHLPYQTTKLAPKRYGPFKIIKEISPVAYQLALPLTWKIHNMFHASLLLPYRETTTYGPNFSRPPPDLINDKEQYEVEQICNHRYFGRNRTVTDCPAYLIFSFLFRLSRSVSVRDFGPLCPLLTYLSMDCSCIFQRLPYVSLSFRFVPWPSLTFW